MRVICLSDTHEQHSKIKVPDGDLLIHAGDLTWGGEPLATHIALNWLQDQSHKFKVFIPGNHDFYFEDQKMCGAIKEACKSGGIYYLNDSACEINGLKIYGSPWTPTFLDWAFMKDRGDEISVMWAKIPLDTDILITHGPPLSVLDTANPGGMHLGCFDLQRAIMKIRPKLHVFGHIHGGYGFKEKSWDDNGQFTTKFVNASICNEDYEPVNQPIVVDL